MMKVRRSPCRRSSPEEISPDERNELLENGSDMRKPFIVLQRFRLGGVSMKNVFVALALMVACLLATNCYAESSSRFQSVGGDYGRDVIGTMTANETQATSKNNDSNSTLWNWGNIPKGNMLVDGKLVEDPFNNWDFIDFSSGSMKTVGVDAFTGNTIYSYKVPNTDVTRYFYIDPYTSRPVYVESSSIMTDEAVSSAGSASQSYALPSAFR